MASASSAEELSEPLLPQIEAAGNDSADNLERSTTPVPQLQGTEEAVVPDDGDRPSLEGVEEGRGQQQQQQQQQQQRRRWRGRVELGASNGAGEPTTTTTTIRPNTGPCWLVCELFYLTHYLLHRPIFSDPETSLRTQIRFLKFLVVTVLGIKWEHRQSLALQDIWLYESNQIMLDLIVFFSVGRLYSQQRSVDHVLWMLLVMLSSMYTSILPKFQWLQHSVTLYEMHCTWPWQLWVFVAGFVLPVCSITLVLHSIHAYKQNDLTRKLVEIALTLAMLLAPQVMNPNFEFHHYYAGLIVGMHANYDTWFSRATMAWCWGQYINGIAVWGRDPILKCAYAQYISERQGCTTLTEWMKDGQDLCWAYQDSSAVMAVPPDWRHCPKTTRYY